MENKIIWEKFNVEQLIFYVQESPCLYDIKSKDYMDRTKKAQALNEIQEKLEEEMPGITVDDIKKKWRNLRSQYLRELRLIQNSKKSGSGVSDIHQPKLWFFEQLTFIKPHCSFRISQDNTEVNSDTSDLKVSVFETEDSRSTDDEPRSKNPRESNQFDEMRREFSSFKDIIEKRKNAKKFDWLGNLVSTQLENIDAEHQQNAAWEVQTVIRKYIAMSHNNIKLYAKR